VRLLSETPESGLKLTTTEILGFLAWGSGSLEEGSESSFGASVFMEPDWTWIAIESVFITHTNPAAPCISLSF
jgi:hypothetical protein